MIGLINLDYVPATEAVRANLLLINTVDYVAKKIAAKLNLKGTV